MVGNVSRFRQALNFQLSLRYKAKRQIRRAFSELGTNPGSVGGSAPRIQSNQTSAQPRSRSSKQSSAAASQQSQSQQRAGQTTIKPTSNSSTQSTTQRRSRDFGNNSRSVSTQGKRTRKAIANTQADKRARDSGGMTSLQTSGIDGKGLKINQIR